MGKKLIREQLHDYIDFADDIIVESIYHLVKSNIVIPESVINETIKVSKNIKNGKEKVYTEKQFRELTKKYKSNEQVSV
jgi:predicted nucleic acid-binding protein